MEVGKIYINRLNGCLVELISDETEEYNLQAKNVTTSRTVEMTGKTLRSIYRLVRLPTDGITEKYVKEIADEHPVKTVNHGDLKEFEPCGLILASLFISEDFPSSHFKLN